MNSQQAARRCSVLVHGRRCIRASSAQARRRRRSRSGVLHRAEERRDGHSPVHMKFGSAGIEIAAVPPGDVTTARPGIGALPRRRRVSCLPPGKTIVKGTPSWVHFGDGKSEIDMQLTPGKHRLALQLGDDLHNTRAGHVPDDHRDREIGIRITTSDRRDWSCLAIPIPRPHELAGSAAYLRRKSRRILSGMKLDNPTPWARDRAQGDSDAERHDQATRS